MIILLAVVIFIIIVFWGSNSDSTNSTQKNTGTTNTAHTLSVQVSPTEPFDPTNPHEIYDVVHLLSAIVAEAGDSRITVWLQDENPAKGWPKGMGLSVTIDSYYTKNHQVDFSDYSGFVKFGLPLSAAKYLASVPFTVSGNDLEYKFSHSLDYPSTYARFIVEEMEKGTRSSRYVQLGLRQITIENRDCLICCKSSD